MKGYYKNQEATDSVIDKNGYLHSGDLGVKDPDGKKNQAFMEYMGIHRCM
jgi:long-subunit acyl-CoA synthetase (AMP-forming)